MALPGDNFVSLEKMLDNQGGRLEFSVRVNTAQGLKQVDYNLDKDNLLKYLIMMNFGLIYNEKINQVMFYHARTKKERN